MAFKYLKKIIPVSMLVSAAYGINKAVPLQKEGDLTDIRMEYKDKSETFLETHIVRKDPIYQFNAWMEDCLQHKDIPEPNAMCLATARKCGCPSARYMLLKSYGNEGFTFFTNYGSRKAEELAQNPNAAATVYWHKLNRSIRIEGSVKKMSPEESKSYFERRPRGNKISTWSSRQSKPVQSRNSLDKLESELNEKYKDDQAIPYPVFWGGYILTPHTIEFWQGQSDRLHDRIRFRKLKKGEVPDGIMLHKGENDWVYERLSP